MALISTMFDSFAVIKRASISRDAAQGVLQNYNQVILANVPCGCQQDSKTVIDVYGQRQTLVTTSLYFAQDPLCDVNDLAVVTNPQTGVVRNFLIEGEAQPVARGEFYTVEARLIRKPKAIGVP